MTDSDEEFAETVALVSAAYLLLEETSTVPVPRVYLTHAVETASAKNDLNFQRLFRGSRALFNNFCALLRTDLEIWSFLSDTLAYILGI
jgi:hypothetical protein